MSLRFPSAPHFGVILASLLLASPLAAATRTWTGAGAANQWSDPANWQGNVAPGAGDFLVFSIGTPTNSLAMTNDLAGTTFGRITFDAPGYSIAGSAVRLSGGVFTTSGAASNPLGLFQTGLLLTADQSFQLADGRSVTVAAPFQLDVGGKTLAVTNGHLLLQNHLTGAGLVSVSGALLSLAGSGNFVGPILINNFGSVSLGLPGNLGTTAAPTFIRSGGSLHLLPTASATLAEELHLEGGSIQILPTNAAATVTLAGPLILGSLSGSSIQCNPAGNSAFVVETHLTGRISGFGNFSKTGRDPLTIAGGQANDYTGFATVGAGLLALAKPAGFAALTGDVTVNGASARLRLEANEQIGDGATVLVSQGGTFELGAQAETISGLVLFGGSVTGTVNALLSLSRINCSSGNGPSQVDATVRLLAAPTELTVNGSEPTDLTFTRPIIGAGGAGFRKLGNGTVRIAQFGGGGLIELTGGTTLLGPTDPSPVTLTNGATLAGTGPVGTITAGTGGGRLDPGDGLGALVSGSVTLDAQSIFAPEIRSADALGHDVLQVTGTVTLHGATLAPVLALPLALAIGDTFAILENDGTDPIVGTFAGLAQGAELTAGGASFRISYTGGTGNDITLTLVDLPITSVVRTWTGLGATTGTGEAQNWNPVAVPQSGDRLVFPLGVPSNRRTVTDTIAGAEFYESLEFGAGGYQLSGDALALRRGIVATIPVAGTETIVSRAIVLSRSQSFSTTGPGVLSVVPTTGPINLNGQTLTLQAAQATSRLNLGPDGAPNAFLTGAGVLVKTGQGTVALRSPSNHTGPTNVLAGTLQASFNDRALGQHGPGNGTFVANGAVLSIGETNGPSIEIDEDLVLEGALRVLCSPLQRVTIRAGLAVAFADRIVEVPDGTLEIASSIQGAGGLQKEGNGRLVLSGTTANAFSGRVLVRAGTLELAKPSGLAAVSGDVVTETGGEVQFSASNQIGGNASLTGGNFSLGAQQETLPSLFVRGATLLGSGLLTLDTLTVAASSASTVNCFIPLRAAGATLTLNVEDGGGAFDFATIGSISAVSPTATLVRLGGGTAVFAAPTTIAHLDLRNGTTLVLDDSSATAVQLNGGTLGGNGTVGAIASGLLGGRVTPLSESGTGILHSGSLSWNASTRLAVRLQNATPGTGHDQLDVTGPVNLNGAVLDVTVLSGFTGPVGTDFLILQNDGAEAITGTFAGLPQNGTFSVGGRSFRISYTGGTGNDVTLRVAQLGTGIVRSWTGNSGADSNWTTPANWNGGVAPTPGDDLIFPLLANRRTNTNNYPAGTTFNSIRVEGAAYVLVGNGIVLNDGLLFQLLGGSASFLLPVTCAQAQAISVQGGQAVIDPATTYANGGAPLTLHVDSLSAGLTVRGLAGSGALRKTGPGPVTLTANTHTGANEFLAGEVLLDGAVTGLGAAPSLTVAAGATLRLNNVPAATLTSPLNLGGTLSFANSPVTFSGAAALDGTDAVVLHVTGAGLPIFSGVLSGLAGLRKTGAGEVIFSGANPNTFAGGLFVEAGVLRAQKTAGSGVAPGPISIGDGSATVAELRLLNANQIPTIPITLKGAGALFNTNGQTETIGNLLMTGGTVSTGGATLNFSGTLNTFAATAPATINGNLTSANGGVRFWTIEDGAAADDLVINGAVNAPVGSTIVKVGEGRTLFAGNSNFPKLRLEFGTAAFSGTSAGVTVELGGLGGNQATLTGNGITGVLTTPTVLGGKIAPSGILTASGNATLNPETRLQIRLLQPTPGSGHDQLSVLGTPALGGAALELTALPGFAPVFGQVFRIVDNSGSGDAVVGTFAGLPEGALLELGGVATLRLSYVGGDGNDVTLTVTRAAGTGLTRVWDGGSGVDSNWTTAANWVGDVVPSPGDALEFPVGAARTSNTNDYPALTTFESIRFSGSGYAVGGTSPLVLNAGLRAEANIGAISFAPPLLLSSPQTFAAEAGAALTLLPSASVNTNGQLLTLQDAVAVGLGAIDLQGVVGGSGGLVKTGSGTIFLRGNNTFSGPVDVQEGGLEIFHANALGTTDVGTTIRAGAFLQFNSASLTVGEPISLLGTVLSTTGTNVLSGPLTLPGPTAGTLRCASPLTVSGVIGGPGALVKTGLADLTIAGTAPNTFTGGFVVQEMNALLQKTAGLAALPGPVTVGNGLPPNELRLLNAHQIANAGVVTLHKATLNLNNLAETVGGLVLSEGTVQTGSATLTIEGDLLSRAAPNPSVLNGQIALAGATDRTWTVEDGAAVEDLQVSAIVSTLQPALVKAGPGRARFAGANTLGSFTAGAGSSIFSGNSGSTSVTLDGGLLGGTGSLADAISGTGGIIAPGLSPGLLTLGGRATWNADTTFAVELNGLDAGTAYDRLNVDGPITLGNAKLAVSVGFTPALGDAFVILRNTGGAPIAGTFAGLPEGAILAVPGGFLFQITYVSGGLNHVTLTRVAGVAPLITNVSIVPGGGAELGLNVITVHASGTPGVTYQLETSFDLQTWTTDAQQLAHASTGVLQFRFTQSPSIPKAFQRVRLP